MSKREELRHVAQEVDKGLSAYVEVHDRIWREAATFGSVLKNLVGHGVPMSRLLEEAERLVPMWNGILAQVETFRSGSASSLTSDESLYLELLSHYAAAVQKTVSALVDRQRLMNEGSRGQGTPVTWELFREKEKLYNSAIEKYVSLGQELNAAASVVFD